MTRENKMVVPRLLQRLDAIEVEPSFSFLLLRLLLIQEHAKKKTLLRGGRGRGEGQVAKKI